MIMTICNLKLLRVLKVLLQNGRSTEIGKTVNLTEQIDCKLNYGSFAPCISRSF